MNLSADRRAERVREVVNRLVERELRAALDALERGLDPATFDRVLEIIAGSRPQPQERSHAK